MSTFDPSAPTLLVVLGPTASGKTSLAINLAKAYKTEIISADSRQCYREISIGTAKPTADQLTEVKHHFIDSHSLQDTPLNAGQFESQTLTLLEQLFKKQQVVVMAGGSGLYIKAVCEGLDQMPKADPKLREELESLYQSKGLASLQQKLKQLDPEYYEIIDQQNPHRLMRAIEVCQQSGSTYTSLRKQQKAKRPFNILKLGLMPNRETLYQRINARVDLMMTEGLLEEANRVQSARAHQALQTVGYTELFQHLDGTWTLEEAVDKIKQHTRNYAKRQLTWLRKESEVHWLEQYHTADVLDFVAKKVPLPTL